MEKFGYCRHCGQALLVKVSGDADQSIIDDAAVSLCDCDGAMREKGIEEAEERLKNVMGPECRNAGFMVVPDAVYKHALEGFCLLKDDDIDSYAMGLCDSTLQVKRTGNGISVTRKRSVVLNG